MMYPRVMNICRFSACHTSNKLEIARRLCQKTNIAADKKAVDPNIKSKLFPDYKVLYMFRYAPFVRIVNGLKKKLSAITFASAPISVGFYYANMLSGSEALGTVALFAMYTLSTFAIGLYSNNMIIYIYLKEDEKKVILTYVDSWGKRVDLHTKMSDIPKFVDLPSRFNDGLYKTFKVESHDKSLKLSLPFAKHIDRKGLELIFGKL